MSNYLFGKKIAVPGGGGFVGSYLVPELQKRGAMVFVPRTEHGWDLSREADVRKLYTYGPFDMVINLAAFQGGIAFHRGRQADMYFRNTLMSTYLMQFAQEAGVKKYINLVAGCSYPGVATEVLEEKGYWDGEVHDSIFSYGFPRKASVVQGKALFKQHGFNSIHLLIANLYGPGEHMNPDQSKALAGMLRRFYEAKRFGIPKVEVWGSGEPIRDWLYVKDAVRLILLACEKYDSIEPLNIASGVGVTVRDLAMIIKRLVGYEGEVIFDSSKPDGAMKKVFSVKRMKEVIGEPNVTPLEDGILETLAWFEANYEMAKDR